MFSYLLFTEGDFGYIQLDLLQDKTAVQGSLLCSYCNQCAVLTTRTRRYLSVTCERNYKLVLCLIKIARENPTTNPPSILRITYFGRSDRCPHIRYPSLSIGLRSFFLLMKTSQDQREYVASAKQGKGDICFHDGFTKSHIKCSSFVSPF